MHILVTGGAGFIGSHTVDAFLEGYDNEKQIFVMGNGRSASTASHLACDINKGVYF